ncbi:MAG: hypothetical protein MN733_01670 [Nitrososphaera sp.]|nr:hypothetical protein [Nitrososphaera sp.]
MIDETDFSDPTTWNLTRHANGYRTTGSGFVACVFPSKQPGMNKWGGWLKRDQPGFEESETLALYWSDSLTELFLMLELARRKQIDRDREQAHTPHDTTTTQPSIEQVSK